MKPLEQDQLFLQGVRAGIDFLRVGVAGVVHEASGVPTPPPPHPQPPWRAQLWQVDGSATPRLLQPSDADATPKSRWESYKATRENLKTVRENSPQLAAAAAAAAAQADAQ